MLVILCVAVSTAKMRINYTGDVVRKAIFVQTIDRYFVVRLGSL